MGEPSKVEAMRAQEVPFMVIWYEDASAAAKALGVDIELPDLGNADQPFWATFDRKAWRAGLRGRVAMSDQDLNRGDPDWVRPAVFPAKRVSKPIELWFDLEDGIVFRCTASSLQDVVALIRTAANRADLKLSETWPGCVIAMQSVAGAGIPADEALRPFLEAAGFRWQRPAWMLSQAPQSVH
jgi:hypothetical protein